MLEIHTNLESHNYTELYEVASQRILDLQKRNPQEISLESFTIVDSKVFKELEMSSDARFVFTGVELKNIVGRPFAESQKGGWSFEYENRKGRISGIAKKFTEATQETVRDLIDYIFHPKQESERIKLFQINGSSGPIYSVSDGTHRVAGCKQAGLGRIPAETRQIKYPVKISDNFTIRLCKQLQDLGMLKGKSISDEIFEIEAEDFPWLRIASPQDRKKISEVYEKVYPDAFSNLKVPRDIFYDQIAFNFFVNGKMVEWIDKNKSVI